MGGGRRAGGGHLHDGLQRRQQRAVLAARGQPAQRGSGAAQHVVVVERGDGGGEVALGAVQLLDLGRDLAHHALAAARLLVDVGHLPAGRGSSNILTLRQARTLDSGRE